MVVGTSTEENEQLLGDPELIEDDQDSAKFRLNFEIVASIVRCAMEYCEWWACLFFLLQMVVRYHL